MRNTHNLDNDKPLRTDGRTLDHAAGLYECLSPLMLLGQEGRLSSTILQALEFGTQSQILDVGCATGKLTQQMAEACAVREGDVWGIDAASKMIDIAERYANVQSNLHFKTALAEDLPFENDTFDIIVSTLFFHHLNKELKSRCLGEMYRTLRPGGKVLIMDVDIPTSLLGRICAWSGYFLFRQDEIKENIQGVLREVMDASSFSQWNQVSHHLGYISMFVLTAER